MKRATEGSDRTRLLVTGVNGDFGQGLVKALRLSHRPFEIHGCDMIAGGIGAKFVESLHTVPAAAAGRIYVDGIEQLCARLRINAVVPGTPAEIEALGRVGPPTRLPSGVPVVCLCQPYREIYNDKLRCYEALESHVDLAPYADGADPEAVAEFVRLHGFPLVVKQRRGQGGLHFYVIRQAEQLAVALAATPAPVVQSYIDDAAGEYSVGVFAADGAETAIAFRRRLGRTGSSWFAETVEDDGILRYVRSIASVSKLRGSANVQLRKSSSGIRLLEVNARFSSLAPARAYAGFRDVEWSVALALGRACAPPSTGFRRFRFQRFVHEMVDEGSGFVPVPQWAPWTQPDTPVVHPRRTGAAFVKRALDVALSLVAMILLGPVMIVVALAVRIMMGRPVLFRASRPGLGGKPFTLLKFRTMRVGDLPDQMRLTRLGRFLRATSLDELPQLWNVLRGEMSLVGPRPLLTQYLGRYSAEQARRHDVKPGITGWAQIHGRNTLDWDERFRQDVWYVDHASTALDLWILVLTVIKAAVGSGVAAPGTGVESEFMGSRQEARQG